MSEANKALIKENDELVRKLVKIRDKGLCRICGFIGTDVHHIISRRHLAIRWNIYNLVLLCRPCHSYAHLESIKFKKQFQRQYELMLDTLNDDIKTDIQEWNEYLTLTLKEIDNGTHKSASK